MTAGVSRTAFDTDMETQNLVLKVKDLCRAYGKKEVLRNLSFELKPGELYGLIGPDGAGKTTAMQILAGVLSAHGGDVKVLGRTPHSARQLIGYLSQQFSLYPDLSIEENLRYVAGLHDVPPDIYEQRKEEFLEHMDLARFKERPSGRLSGGMKQKLALCCALISEPALILMDEPTAGVDPLSRREFWQLVRDARERSGTAILLATPYWDEAEFCDRIGLMMDGTIQLEGTPADLKSALNLNRIEVYTNQIDKTEEVCRGAQKNEPGIIADVSPLGDRVDLLVPRKASLVDRIGALLHESGVAVQRIELSEPSVENVFYLHMAERGEVPATAHALPENAVRVDSNQTSAIVAKNLRKQFGSFIAVHDFNLEIKRGEIYGLLGANGAGKTTTIQMLCGLQKPSAGQIKILGESAIEKGSLRKRIGYMSQKSTLYGDLTVAENLELFAGVYEIPLSQRKSRIEWMVKACGLTNHTREIVASLPRGWKQRVAFAAAVMHYPELIFLDEPSSGVDPVARRELWSLIRLFAANGASVLLTTHFLDEAEYCNRLGVMVAGQILAEASPSELKSAQNVNNIEAAFIKLVQEARYPGGVSK